MGGHAHSLAGHDGILWCGSRFLPTNSAEQNKQKVFGAKSWASSWRLLVFFVLERNFSHAWGGGGAQVPKCTPVAPGLLFSFEAQSSLGEGAGPQNAPHRAGPAVGWSIFYQLLKVLSLTPSSCVIS